jgi:ApbE superfamily uncharacterized protein (UPF0280 family)
MSMKEELHIRETHLKIIADDFSLEGVKQFVIRQRTILQEFIDSDPFFQTTYEVYRCPENAPEIVRLLCSASERSGIGPMSAVAGTFSYLTARYILEEQSASWVVVENGGDIALKINEPYTLGIYAGEESPVKDMGFKLEPRDHIFGICTSSGTVGPSVSLGVSDAATVISNDVALADSCATLLGNQVRSRTPSQEDMDGYFDRLKTIENLDGAMIIVDDKIALFGALPEMVRTKNPTF